MSQRAVSVRIERRSGLSVTRQAKGWKDPRSTPALPAVRPADPDPLTPTYPNLGPERCPHVALIAGREGHGLAAGRAVGPGNLDMPARTPVLLDSVGAGAYDGQGALTPPWALPKVCQVLGEGPSFSRTLASSPLELRGA